MGRFSLIESKIQAGHWHGLVAADQGGDEMPTIEITHMGRALGGVEIAPAQSMVGHWTVRMKIPADTLADGLVVFMVCDANGNEPFGHFSLVVGEAVERNMASEIELLRAELDMLRHAFRRHCLATGA